MRLTILINGPDLSINHDYVVLWLDTEERRWSREAHAGVDLPEWGEIHCISATTVLTGSKSTKALCVLRDLSVSCHEEVSHADGLADMHLESSARQVDWHWRLQAVDRTHIRAASTLFASDLPARTAPASAAFGSVSTRSEARRHG